MQRIQRDRQLAKEFEEEQERIRQAYLKAMEENRHQHDSANKIQNIFRMRKCIKYVNEKRIHLVLEGKLLPLTSRLL